MILSFFLIGCHDSNEGKNYSIDSDSNKKLEFIINYIREELPKEFKFDHDITSVDIINDSSDKCHYFQSDHRTIETMQASGSLCLFEVALSSSSSTNTLISSSTLYNDSNEWQLIRTISKNHVIGDGDSITIKFSDELSDLEHPSEDYTLSDVAYVVDNMGVYSLDTNPIDDSLTLEVNDVGVKRIIYSYENGSGNVIQGLVYIVVTNEENMAFDSKDLFFKVGTTDSTTIELDDVLVEAKENVTFYDVVAYDRADISMAEDNQSFTFTAKTAGKFDINYVLEDGLGGFSSGVIRFVSTGSEGGLQHIFVEPLASTFNYVKNIAEAKNEGNFSHHSTYIENGKSGVSGQEYPIYSYESAIATCLVEGLTLPTVDEFEQLWNQEGSLFDGVNHRNWPVGVPYITWDGVKDEGLLLDMSSSSSFPTALSGSNMYGYVTCLGGMYDGFSIIENVVSKPTQLHVQPTYGEASASAIVSITDWDIDDSSKASISSSGLLTPLVSDGEVRVTAMDNNGNSTSKLMKIKNNGLSYNSDGVETGLDPYFNDSAVSLGLIPDSDISSISCSSGVTEFTTATGFDTSAVDDDKVGMLCTNSYYTPFSGSGMFVGYIYGDGKGAGEGTSLEGKYNFLDLDGRSEIVYSGALNVNDVINFTEHDAVFYFVIQDKKESGQDNIFVALKYDTELEKWTPSIYFGSDYDINSQLLSSDLYMNESTGWLHFDVSIRLSSSAPNSGESVISYTAHLDKLESATILKYALDELSIVTL